MRVNSAKWAKLYNPSPNPIFVMLCIAASFVAGQTNFVAPPNIFSSPQPSPITCTELWFNKETFHSGY